MNHCAIHNTYFSQYCTFCHPFANPANIAPTTDQILMRLASALERIAFCLENPPQIVQEIKVDADFDPLRFKGKLSGEGDMLG